MTIPSRKCLIINHMIFILQGATCTKRGEILLFEIEKNTTDTYPVHNYTSTRFHEIADKHTTIGNSKENLLIIEPTTKTESHKMRRDPAILHSTETVFSIITTSINNSSKTPSKNNTNLTSRLINTTPNISNIRVGYSATSTVGLGGNSKDEPARFGDLNPHVKSKRNIRLDAKGKNSTQNSELQPEGYIYDLNHCQYVDNRVLCGYDKNPEPPKRKEVVDLDDLCKKHGDRIECGYVTGPFPDAYNPDPEKDKIAKINLSDYKNVARAIDNDVDMILRTGNVPNESLSEIIKLRDDMVNLLAALPADNNFTFVTDNTAPTINAISATTTTMSTSPPQAPTSRVTKDNSDPNVTQSEILKTDTFKLMHASFMTPRTTRTLQVENTSEKKCLEKDGRIFCSTE